MAVGRVTLRFTEESIYTDDRGEEQVGGTNFGIPDGLATAGDDVFNSIATTAGAELKAIQGRIINDIPDAICPDANVRFRKLAFLINDGTSLSVPISTRESLITTAQSLADTINGALPDENRVVCIKLIGEEFPDLTDLLEVNFDSTVFAEETTSSRKYSGYTERTYDRDSGTGIIINVQINTDQDNAPPNPLSQAWEGCVGALNNNAKTCGGGNKYLFPRHYIAYYQSAGGRTISHKVPVLSDSDGEILACGQGIVTSVGGSLFCVSYKGEDDQRFHKRQGIDLSA